MVLHQETMKFIKDSPEGKMMVKVIIESHHSFAGEKFKEIIYRGIESTKEDFKVIETSQTSWS